MSIQCLFYFGDGYTGIDIALSNGVQDCRDGEGYHCCSHHLWIDRGIAIAKVEQSQRDCACLVAIQVDQRVPGIAPAIEKSENCYYNQDRSGLWQNDMPPDAQVTAAIDMCRFVQFTR